MKFFWKTAAGTKVVTGFIFLALAAGRVDALVEPDHYGLISVTTSVSADSVAVGQRFRVRHGFAYPDSLVMLDVPPLKTGNCRVVSQRWEKESSGQTSVRTAVLVLVTLDLEAARFPEMTVDFKTPSGDTLRTVAEEVIVPVRRLTTEAAQPRPLKAQWVAPASHWKWIAGGAVLLAVAAALWYWRRRRSRKTEEAPREPKLPADYVALTELTRIEKMNLLADGQYKKFYSLVTHAVRRYIADRFRVDALDRTTRELLLELENIGQRIDRLEELLKDADMVKFAKYVPGRETAAAALTTARKIVVSTAPRTVVPGVTGTEDDGRGPTAAGQGGR